MPLTSMVIMARGLIESFPTPLCEEARDNCCRSADFPLPGVPTMVKTPWSLLSAHTDTAERAVSRAKNFGVGASPVSTSRTKAGPATDDHNGFRIIGRESPTDALGWVGGDRVRRSTPLLVHR